MQARQAHGPAVAAAPGRLPRAQHAVPVDRVESLVGVDDQPLPRRLADAAEPVDGLGLGLPARFTAPVRAFLAASPPRGHPPVFSHGGLGIEHVLVDPATFAVTGVLEWTDAALVDPAYDLGLLHRDLGPMGVAPMHAYGPSTVEVPERALSYARCSVLEDLAYGLQTGLSRYVGNSLAAQEWLFSSNLSRRTGPGAPDRAPDRRLAAG